MHWTNVEKKTPLLKYDKPAPVAMNASSFCHVIEC